MPSIIQAFKQYRAGTTTDPHHKIMMRYPEVPMWWYGLTMAISFVLAMVTCYTYVSPLALRLIKFKTNPVLIS